MLNDDEINAQRDLLAAHRHTLATLLKQYALHNPAYVPPAIVAGIDHARAEISRIKEVLRVQNITVDDHPDDDASIASQPGVEEQYAPPYGGIYIGNGMRGGNIRIGNHAQIAKTIVNTNYSNIRSFRGLLVLGLAVGVLVLTGIGLLVLRPWFPAPPMPEGGWNVAMAEIAWDNGDGIARMDRRTAYLSARIYPVIESRVDSDHSRRVPSLTGDRTERARQAAIIAARTNASVVVYGMVRPTTPGVGQFQPEFYISPNIRNATLSVNEIVGTNQFGTPIEVALNTTRGSDEDAIGRRVSALEFVLNGLNEYIAERYDSARSELMFALKALGPDADGQTAAVIHEFLAATELGAKHYDQALREVEHAHQLWPSYARPYLTRASIRYAQANALLPASNVGLIIRLPQPMPRCFDSLPNKTPDIGWYLAEALACYDESLQAANQAPDIDLADKVAYSKANIYITLAFYGGGNYWNNSLPLLEQVINHYQVSQSVEERQRLRRLVAHAYARRGLFRFYAPGSTSESQAAALNDYQTALDLLETIEPGVTCHNKPETCYKSDLPFIDIYSRQLQQIKSAIEQAR